MAAENIGYKEFESLLRQEQPVLVDFWAPWCGYCRRIGPAYDRIARDFGDRVRVVKVNIDDEPALAEQERIEVLPTLVMYHGGKDLGSLVAPASGAAIEAFIQQWI